MNENDLHDKAKELKLHGLLDHWDEVCHANWLSCFLGWEEQARSQRSLERRLQASKIGRLKLLSEFNWEWPKRCDKETIMECMRLNFIKEVVNVVLCGPNGVGKSTIAKNIAYQAVLEGYTALFVTAGQMLNELSSHSNDNALHRRIKHYEKPHVLVIDEVGYLSYSNRHADLLFEVISRRYQEKPTIITTNKPFSEWGEIFPNASCVVSLIDRLVHHSEIVTIEAESYRLKEATERNQAKKESRVQKSDAET